MAPDRSEPSQIDRILAKRRDRSIAIILSVKEREVDSYLPPVARAKLRKVILDTINDFHDLAIDLLRSCDIGDIVLNELYLQKIEDLHSDMGEIRKLLSEKV